MPVKQEQHHGSQIIQRYSEKKLIDSIHRSWNHMIQVFASYPKVEYRETQHYSLLDSGTTVGMLNRVMDTNLPKGKEEHTIQEVINYFKPKNLPFTWQVDPWDKPTYLAEHLEKAGFIRDETPSMAIKISQLHEPKLPECLIVEKCDTPEKVTTYSWLLCKAYGMPETIWDWLAGAWINNGLTSHIHHYIGYINGIPVASSSIMYGDGVVGLYNVATLPEYRGKGIGAAISYAPFIDAEKTDYKFGILHASKMGYPVYQRLGFQEICKKVTYEWNPEGRST